MSVKKWLNDHNLAVSAVGVSLVVAFFNLFSPSLYRRPLNFPYFAIENQFQDWVAQLGKSNPRDPRVFFLYDDAASHNLSHVWDDEFEAAPILKRMKTREWPRDVFAAILDRLAGAGAKVVGFDYVFQAENEQLDPQFRAVLDKYKDRVVLASQLDDSNVSFQRTRQINQPSSLLIPSIHDPRVGYINVFPDPDNIVRRFQFQCTLEELSGLPALPDSTEYESLPVRMLRIAGLDQNIPKDRDFHLLRFAYKGETRADMSRPQSVANIFIPSVWESNYQNGAFFKDKIVLVGPTGNLNKDIFASAFGIIGGPEFHLNVIHGLISKAFLHESPAWVDALLIAVSGLCAALAGRVVRNPILRIAIVTLIGVGFFASAVWLFDQNSVIIPVFSPLLCLIGSSFTFVVWQQLIERLERVKLRRTFERYVSRDVVKELLDNPESYLNSMVGVRKEVTVLFSDIRGFTSLTESGDAQPLVAQLNEYFDHMVGIVFANRGTLDKFIGDAVMAQWGGITTSGPREDAINAVRTGLQMQERLTTLNAAWIKQGKLDLKVGIGINAGEAIVGNLGCEAKAEISLIGDAVNTASRFESMTKQYHVGMLIGEAVAALVRDQFILRTVGQSRPKGKLKPVEIFTVLGERTPGTVDPEWLADYEAGVKLYRQREFAEAVKKFEAALSINPDDWLCESYLEDSLGFAANPPPPDWSPVDVMTTK